MQKAAFTVDLYCCFSDEDWLGEHSGAKETDIYVYVGSTSGHKACTSMLETL